MKYSAKFPDMNCYDDERENMIRGRDMLPCIICGDDTEFVEINYEARLCSEECVAEMDRVASEVILKAEHNGYLDSL